MNIDGVPVNQGPAKVNDALQGIGATKVSGANPIYAFLADVSLSGTSYKTILFVEQITDYNTTRTALANTDLGGGFTLTNGEESIVAGVTAFVPPESAPDDYIPNLTADGNGGTTAVGTYVSSLLGYTDGSNNYRGAVFTGPPTSAFNGYTFYSPDGGLMGYVQSEGESLLTNNTGLPIIDGSVDIYGVVSYLANDGDPYYLLWLTDDESGLSAALNGSGWSGVESLGVLFTSGGAAAGKDFEYAFSSAPPASSSKAISTFNFSALTPAVTGTVNESAKTVALTVPYGTSLTALVPTITVSDLATISPTSGTAQNFTSPVTYTVTAENASSQEYVVTVTVANPPPLPPSYSPPSEQTTAPQPEEPKIYTQSEYDSIKSLLGQKITDLQNEINRLQSIINQGSTPEPQQPSPEPISQPTTLNKYTVQSGDSLYAIALRFYGQGSLWVRLVELNKINFPSLITSPGVIIAGWVLNY
jgi:LysM repeat protein